jgi:hypothetical protein
MERTQATFQQTSTEEGNIQIRKSAMKKGYNWKKILQRQKHLFVTDAFC